MRTLEECQAELIARGATDIKFCWAPEELTSEQRKEGLLTFLNAYLDGKYVSAEPIGDAEVLKEC